MSIFRCEQCGCRENTALSNYTVNLIDGKPLICSECETGKWHGKFPKRSADGSALGADGKLYSPGNPPTHTRIVGIIGQEPHNA